VIGNGNLPILEVAEPERRPGDRCCVPLQGEVMSLVEAESMTADLSILAHPVRVRLLDVIARSESAVCQCDLEGVVPVKQPTLSHHLKLLREAGLIECERRGLWTYCTVRRDALRALRERIDAGMARWAGEVEHVG
jgi:ArsR family transcriptional regulator, arsenate/arsenite/antimonite-responsive transcriptional repressor